MTLRDALSELEDRGVPEVIELIRWMDREIREKSVELATLKAKLSEIEYGGF